MLVHSLTKSSIFFTVGHASQMHGTQEMARIRGLIRGNPLVGWGLVLGVMAIVGMPPFGVFTSEFLILTATIKDAPLLAPFLLLGLGGRLCRAVPQGAADGGRDDPSLAKTAQGRQCPGLSAAWSGAGARHLLARFSGATGSSWRWRS